MDTYSNLSKSLGTFLIVYVSIMLLLLLAVYALSIIARWKLFEKAGEKGWKAIVPFYNGHVMFKLIWKPRWYWITLITYLAGTLMINFCMNKIDFSVGSLNAANVMIIIFYFASWCMWLVVDIKSNIYMAKSFGRDRDFAIGLILLRGVFFPILGLGKSEYKGNAWIMKLYDKSNKEQSSEQYSEQ